MLVLKINDVKNFMNQLLIGQTFDDFSLVDASITTFCSFMIDGTLHRDFFDSDSKQPSVQSALYCPWKELKSYCYSIIRGKLPPLHFRITFQLNPSQLTQILPAFSDVITDPAIRGLNLNLQYKNHELFCTSGISSDVFIPDKSPEFIWDSFITDYFRSRQINFDRL